MTPSRYIVTVVSVGDAGLVQRPAVFDTEELRTIKVYRATERHLADSHAERLNNLHMELVNGAEVTLND